MTDQKISELNAITGANVADASDKLAIVDASGNETKAITRGELFSSVSQITTDTAGDSVAIKALRTINSGTGDPVVIVAGDGDSSDVLVEMRGNTDATLVDTADTKESSDAQFIFYGNGASTFNGPLTLNSNATITGDITITGTVDGYDVSALGSKLSGIEAGADVTDTANVTAAIGQGVGTSDSPSFAGLTVDTSTLHVDSTNDRVGIGTASPSTPLDIATSGYVKLRIDDGVNTPFSVGTGANGINIENNTAANNTDEYITLFATDSSIRLGTSGSEAVRISSGGSVGIGTTSPSEKLDVFGNVTISGSLSKGSGSFKIDHPLKPETHHLVHSFVEAPQADNIYRGRVDLVDGVATVNLDEAGRMTEGTFVLLNGNVQCFTSNETDWCPVRGSVNGNILTIEAQDNTCTDTISWLVIGERIDQHMIDTNWTDENGRIIVEPEKVIMEPEEEAIV